MDALHFDDEEMREVPNKKLWWDAVYFVSETGMLRRRYYNPMMRTWVWGDAITPRFVRDRLGYRINGQFHTIEQAIALAWVKRRIATKHLCRVVLKDPREGVIAYNLKYADEDDCESGSESSEDEEGVQDEVWKDLKCKIGIVPCENAQMQVSNLGRVRSADGTIHCGTVGAGLSRFVRVSNVGLIPIDATKALFDGSRYEKPPPRIRNILILLKHCDLSIEMLAQRLKIKESTAWLYVTQGMRYVSTQSAQHYLRKLLQKSHPLEHALRNIFLRQPHLLTSRLTPLVGIVNREMAADPDWPCNRFRFAEVAALRMQMQRE